jgi:hypothetical protein
MTPVKLTAAIAPRTMNPAAGPRPNPAISAMSGGPTPAMPGITVQGPIRPATSPIRHAVRFNREQGPPRATFITVRLADVEER